ncbi:site-specific integrase [Sphaerisporangium sp. NPDC049002]|uniref:tyrosine-type recombinase/integrase n=1 Tax=Sphaerisporangium sp. NPDC049002 TaxID=3155392 RepID=UPI0033EBFCA4
MLAVLTAGDELTCDALDAYIAERGDHPGVLFATRNGKPLAVSYVRKLIQRIAEQVKVPQALLLSPHSVRHTVITNGIAMGVPVERMQWLADHADARTTKVYDHTDGIDRSPVQLMGQRTKMGVMRHVQQQKADVADEQA